MTFAELDIAPRTRGRASIPLQVDYVREMRETDLALLASSRGSVPPAIKELRERHHSLARLLAQGMKDAECSAVTGYSVSRISILKHDPTFIELVAHYRQQEDSLLADFSARAGQMTLTAMDALLDKLENDPDSMPDTMKLELAKFGADRTGFGPQSKQTNVNINVDLGSRLAAARKRVAQQKVIDAEFREVPRGTPSDAG